MNWFKLLLQLLQPAATAPKPTPPKLEVVPPPDPEPAPPSTTDLTTNFSVKSFERSGTAARHGINNKMGVQETTNARMLAANVLQPARNHFGVAIIVNSGYRCEVLNTLLKGAPRSDHMDGKAADIDPTGGVTLRQLGKWIQDNCEFRQLILEHDQWIHVSYDINDNKKQVLQAYYKTVNGRRRTRYRRFKFE